MLVPAAGSLDGNASALFERLRAWRDSIAGAEDRPHYTVLADATLRAIASTCPTTDEALLAIPGIAETKLARYGADLRKIVSEHTGQGVDAPTSQTPPHLAVVEGRTYHEERVNEARELHARAFERWSDEEDALLRTLIEDGAIIDDIVRALERQPNAIRIRAERLGLADRLAEPAAAG
jgi:ribonuclease D